MRPSSTRSSPMWSHEIRTEEISEKEEVDLSEDNVEKTWINFDGSLEWQGKITKKRMSWKTAKLYAKVLGHGWRLPTLKELRSLLCIKSPVNVYHWIELTGWNRCSIPREFREGHSVFWTNDIVDAYIPGVYDNHIKIIDFNDNDTSYHRHKRTLCRIRCVRKPRNVEEYEKIKKQKYEDNRSNI